MKKMYKLFSVIALGISISSATIASANDEYGGTWDYGYTAVSAYSAYKHDYNPQGAKVVNSKNGASDVANASSGVWARASIWDPATFYFNPYGYY